MIVDPGSFRSSGKGEPLLSTQHRVCGNVVVLLARRSISRKKRTDTVGFLVGLVIHGADIQDRDGAPEVLKSIAKAYPLLRHVFADGGYAGPKLRAALAKIGSWESRIVKRSDAAVGFAVSPRRWVVERTPDQARGRRFAWLGRCRRVAKDWEKSIAGAEAWLIIADIRRVIRLHVKL